MNNKIEQIIGEIEDYIESCKYQSFSNTKIIVNKDELEDLLSELRRKTPDEIKRYQRMISNKEAILADAQAKADAIIAQAEVQTTELISEHQIMHKRMKSSCWLPTKPRKSLTMPPRMPTTSAWEPSSIQTMCSKAWRILSGMP